MLHVSHCTLRSVLCFLVLKCIWEYSVYAHTCVHVCVYVGYTLHVCVCSITKLCPSLFRPHGLLACQDPLSMGFPRQEYWSGLPFPSLGDLSDPGIELTLLVPPELTGRFFTTGPPGKSIHCIRVHICIYSIFIYRIYYIHKYVCDIFFKKPQ